MEALEQNLELQCVFEDGASVEAFQELNDKEDESRRTIDAAKMVPVAAINLLLHFANLLELVRSGLLLQAVLGFLRPLLQELMDHSLRFGSLVVDMLHAGLITSTWSIGDIGCTVEEWPVSCPLGLVRVVARSASW